MNKRNLSFLAFYFILSLTWFCFNFRHYPSQNGEISFPWTSSDLPKIDIGLDSGTGFNTYEIIKPEFPPTVDGIAKASFILPQTRLRQLRITNAGASPISKVTMSLTQGETASTFNIDQLQPNSPWLPEGFVSPEPIFSGFLFGFQILIALFFGYLLTLLTCLPTLLGQNTWRKTTHVIFFENQRQIFWTMWILAMAIHSVWLLGYWPAWTTDDSWASMADIQTLQFSFWQPITYALYLLSFFLFTKSLALVVMFQIATTTGLTCLILFNCLRGGVSKWIIGFLYAFFIFSVAIGEMNLMIWKDIPFAILLLLFSYFVFASRLRMERKLPPILIPTWFYPILVLLCIMLLSVRHNGEIFYIIAPILLWKCMDKKAYRLMLVTFACWYVGYSHVYPYLAGVKKVKGSPYHQLRTALNIATHFNFYSKTREDDFQAIAEAADIKWEVLKEKFPTDYFFIFDNSRINREYYNPGSGETDKYNTSFVIRLIWENLPIYLGSRTWEFFHTVGIDTTKRDANNGYYQNPIRIAGTSLEPPGFMRFRASSAAEPKSYKLKAFLDKVDTWGRTFDGLSSPFVIQWNVLIWISFLGLIIVLERPSSAIFQFTLPSLTMTGAMFAIGALTESWRYLYYHLLIGIVAVPLYLYYRRHRPVAKS